MIYLKSPEEIEGLRLANRLVVKVMQTLKELIRPGIMTEALDVVAEKIILEGKGKPAFKGYRGFPKTLCVSINEEVVHGIPGQRRLVEGEIVSIDCGVFLKGFYGDHAWTFPVGRVSEKVKKLLAVGEESLRRGIEKMRVGNRLGDISDAVQSCAESHGFSIVRDFVGHGIGQALHEEPQLPNFGTAGTGLRLKPGLVLALEPMINEGTYEVKTKEDGWTVVTRDGKCSVHFEHSVALTQGEPDVLSRWE